MTSRKHKILFWSLKVASIFVSCALPIWAICERFPIWTEAHGTGRTVGAGSILIGIVLLVVFRRTVFDLVRDRLDLKHAPPLLIWCIMLVVSYIFVYLGEVMRDMTTIFWMGFIGCVLGTILTYLSNRFKEDVTDE